MAKKGEPTFLLPEELRERLKHPLGRLFPDIAVAVGHLRKLHPARFVTVGDLVTAEFVAAGIRPDVAVVDFHVMRTPVAKDVKAKIDSFDARVVNVKNPAGTITPEMRRVFEVKPPLKVVVDGEEDLATIPAVLSVPKGSVVAYGQPGEGVVLIEVTESKRREFKDLINKFKK